MLGGVSREVDQNPVRVLRNEFSKKKLRGAHRERPESGRGAREEMTNVNRGKKVDKKGGGAVHLRKKHSRRKVRHDVPSLHGGNPSEGGIREGGTYKADLSCFTESGSILLRPRQPRQGERLPDKKVNVGWFVGRNRGSSGQPSHPARVVVRDRVRKLSMFWQSLKRGPDPPLEKKSGGGGCVKHSFRKLRFSPR